MHRCVFFCGNFFCEEISALLHFWLSSNAHRSEGTSPVEITVVLLSQMITDSICKAAMLCKDNYVDIIIN